MIRRLFNLKPSEPSQGIVPDVIQDGARVIFIADADIDCDGPNGNPDEDPYWQPSTALKKNGESLDSYLVPGVVVPPGIVQAVHGIVLGCLARITYNNRSTIAVVYDIGPSRKLGEISVEAARRVGMNPSPISGGTDDYNSVAYEIFPGTPAYIDGIRYDLQPST